ncbi:MAG: hypothetical protein ACP5N1_05835 [Candidatus Woesearchaeota archaeon]
MDTDKFLKDVPNNNTFWFNNGIAVRNIYEFLNELKQLSDECFKYHCNDKNDDFASWIGAVLEDITLAERLRSIKDKQKYIHCIEKRIKHVEHKHRLHVLRLMAINSVKSWFNKYNISFKVTIVILVLAIITLSFIQYYSTQNIRLVSDKLKYIEERDSCFNSYLNNRIDGIESNNYTQIELTCQKDYTLIINNEELENLPSRLLPNDIQVYDDRVIITINNSSWAIFKNTSSMLPIINHNTKAIEIKPEKMSDINIGDIVSFVSTTDNEIVVHRVIGKERDSDGYYLITKGDNNQNVDIDKVRFEQVQGVVVMLVY